MKIDQYRGLEKWVVMALWMLIMILYLCSCRQEAFQPDYHVDVFRCKVNGEEWVAHCPSEGLWGCEPVDCQYWWLDTKGISIGAIRQTRDKLINQSLGFAIHSTKLGENTISLRKMEHIDWNKIAGCRFFNLDTNSIRVLNIIEVDTIIYSIKGNFEFTCINECKDTIHVTEGYFHVNYRF